MPTTAHDAMLRRCPGAIVGPPDDDIFGQTIQPALYHIECMLPAHPCAKETSQLSAGELWCSRNAEIYAPKSPHPVLRVSLGKLHFY